MAMVAADRDGRIVGWNHSATRLFGAGPGEMLHSEWWNIVPQEERELARKASEKSVHTGETTEFSFASRDRAGGECKLAAIVTPIAAQSGECIGTLAVIRDITNRMVLENRLAKQSRMAALGEMAGALSHHFNNILGGVVTSVDFALTSEDSRLHKRVMEKTAEALNRATALVDNLLAFAEGGYRDANLSDLSEVMIELVRRTEERLRGTRLKLEVELGSIPVMEVPRAAVLTAFSNLVDNAVEAMPDEGTLRIEMHSDEEFVFLRISDTGCGLDEEALARVFEPFYSTKDKTGPDGQHSRGLGLAVTHGVLKVLQGTIHVVSTVGVGTAFEVRLPVPRQAGSRLPGPDQT